MYLKKKLDFVIALLTAGPASRPRGNSAHGIGLSQLGSDRVTEQSGEIRASQSDKTEEGKNH